MLAFTVFPLGYSLYLAFYKIEQKVEVTRDKEPMLDAKGKPVLDAKGQPRTKNVVHKQQVNIATFIGSTISSGCSAIRRWRGGPRHR